MEPSKRGWLYAGLAVVAGVGLVTVVATPVEALGLEPEDEKRCRRLKCLGEKEKRVLLLGDFMASGLSTSMQKLAEGDKVELVSVCRSGTNVADWPAILEKEGALKKEPKIALVAIGPADLRKKDGAIDLEAMKALTKLLRDAGAAVVWVAPPKMPVEDPRVRDTIRLFGDMFPSHALQIPRGPDGLRPTAAGFAGWAGALWRWLS